VSKPRLTKDVREGWDGIRAFITCELEAAQASQWECREHYRRMAEEGTSDVALPDGDTCPCEGCTARRQAWKAVAWIDARI